MSAEHFTLRQADDNTQSRAPPGAKSISCIKEDLGPAMAPSSKYQAWKGMLEQALSPAIFITRMFKTSENSMGPSGSPCWTPDSDDKHPSECQRWDAVHSTSLPKGEVQESV